MYFRRFEYHMSDPMDLKNSDLEVDYDDSKIKILFKDDEWKTIRPLLHLVGRDWTHLLLLRQINKLKFYSLLHSKLNKYVKYIGKLIADDFNDFSTKQCGYGYSFKFPSHDSHEPSTSDVEASKSLLSLSQKQNRPIPVITIEDEQPANSDTVEVTEMPQPPLTSPPPLAPINPVIDCSSLLPIVPVPYVTYPSYGPSILPPPVYPPQHPVAPTPPKKNGWVLPPTYDICDQKDRSKQLNYMFCVFHMCYVTRDDVHPGHLAQAKRVAIRYESCIKETFNIKDTKKKPVYEYLSEIIMKNAVVNVHEYEGMMRSFFGPQMEGLIKQKTLALKSSFSHSSKK